MALSHMLGMYPARHAKLMRKRIAFLPLLSKSFSILLWTWSSPGALWFFDFFIARLNSESVKVCWNVDMETLGVFSLDCIKTSCGTEEISALKQSSKFTERLFFHPCFTNLIL